MLNKNIISNFFQKYRFFYIFIIIGFTSLIIEFFIYNILSTLKFNSDASSFIGLIVGIIFAFYLNFFFNFEIHKSKITKAFIVFELLKEKLIAMNSELSEENFEEFKEILL